MNMQGGAIVFPKKRHPILKDLSFRTTPVIAGLNRFTAKTSSETLLEARPILARYGKDDNPMLVHEILPERQPADAALELPLDLDPVAHRIIIKHIYGVDLAEIRRAHLAGRDRQLEQEPGARAA